MNFKVTYEKIHEMIAYWAKEIVSDGEIIVGISRGGIVPAFMLANKIGAPFKVVDAFVEGSLEEFRGKCIVLVDDILDTGATKDFFKREAEKAGVADIKQVFLVTKYSGDKDTWFEFPWETESDTVGGREQATVAILRSIGEDPMREGLKDTPKRVAKLWSELTSGYDQSFSEKLLNASFSAEKYDAMIILKDIRFFSTCEHHLLPFYGKVHFGYLPSKKVVGVSKIVRLVDAFSRRLQIQERMTVQIGQTFEELVKPLGVGVLVEGLHLCMMLRGVRRENPVMKTSYLGGCFRDEQKTREEFLGLVK